MGTADEAPIRSIGTDAAAFTEFYRAHVGEVTRNHPHERLDPEARHRGHLVQHAEHVHPIRRNAHLLPGLAQRRMQRRLVRRIARATGKRDLPGVTAQRGRALGEQRPRLAAALEQGDQHRRLAQLEPRQVQRLPRLFTQTLTKL